jgi:hypothetical protein
METSMNDQNVAEGQAVSQRQAVNQPAPAQAPRGAQVKLPDGTTLPIKEYVTRRFHETHGDRGQIAAELGKTYQYVYNMTKGPEFQNVGGQARNRNATIEVVPGQPQPGHERTARKSGGGHGTIAVGGSGNQQASAVEEVSPDEIEAVLGAQTDSGSTDAEADVVDAEQQAAE